MSDLRSDLQEIVGQFVSAVLDAARSAPLSELASEAKWGEPSTAAISRGNAARVTRVVKAGGPLDIPRGVRGAPTAQLRALEWQRQLDSGEVRSKADIARREGLTRARVTQIMNLLRGRASAARARGRGR